MEYPSLDTPTAGALRFNTDSGQLEIYDGNQWTGVQPFNAESGCGERGLCFGAQTPTVLNTIQYITITSTGDSVDFGDLSVARTFTAGVSSQTRGISVGGYVPSSPNVTTTIDYVTIASTGNANDFGDMITATSSAVSGSNGTRGIMAGGDDGPSQINSIQYITIASQGNAADFGDLDQAQESAVGMCNSATRMLVMGGYKQSGDVYLDTIDYVTMATLGDSVDFGTLLDGINHGKQCSTSTRGIVMGGEISGNSGTDMIQYVTIASSGNAIDFGDLLDANWYSGALSGRIRGVSFNRYKAPSFNDTIEYVNIVTTGNAVDFGNSVTGNSIGTTGCISNAHGGL